MNLFSSIHLHSNDKSERLVEFGTNKEIFPCSGKGLYFSIMSVYQVENKKLASSERTAVVHFSSVIPSLSYLMT